MSGHTQNKGADLMRMSLKKCLAPPSFSSTPPGANISRDRTQTEMAMREVNATRMKHWW